MCAVRISNCRRNAEISAVSAWRTGSSVLITSATPAAALWTVSYAGANKPSKTRLSRSVHKLAVEVGVVG
jgi:hypothetical protein